MHVSLNCRVSLGESKCLHSAPANPLTTTLVVMMMMVIEDDERILYLLFAQTLSLSSFGRSPPANYDFFFELMCRLLDYFL